MKSDNKVQEIEDKRIGGAAAITGFDYQCLYSMYVLLTHLNSNSDFIRFEGIEDIDSYTIQKKTVINHIQVKYSSKIQNANYMKDILKNFLEIYLIDKDETDRNFTLIYDFEVSNGNFKHLINRKTGERLGNASEKYWKRIIREIEIEKKYWNWENFDFYDFLDNIFFENILQTELMSKISIKLIELFDITVGNELLYAHSLYHFSFNGMKNREKINIELLRKRILFVSDEINKGVTNPSYKWLKKIDFLNDSNFTHDSSFFEGKKAEISDIISELPIRRKNLEESVTNSLNNNDITVIKAQSGQGKSTLALQVIYNLRKQYSAYQLDWCNEKKEIEHFVQFIESRVKIGEIPLIFVDNLNASVSEWGSLSEELRKRVKTNFKLLVTSREDDWHFYSGDHSNLRKINVLELSLNRDQAREIYQQFKKNNFLHKTVKSWQAAWERVSSSGVLIEFTYYLTHGDMLSNRLNYQLSELSKRKHSNIEIDILYKICFADTLDIPINIAKLSEWYQKKHGLNIDMFIAEMENEYFIKYYKKNKYFIGTHPVRSKHIVDILSYRISQIKLIEIIDLIDNIYISKVYSKFPEIVSDEKEYFYSALIEDTKGKSYSYYLNALKGIYSGTILTYFYENKEVFDFVSIKGGLTPFTIEISPFSKFPEFNVEVNTLSELMKISPENDNIVELYNLSQRIPKLRNTETDIHIYSTLLSKYLKDVERISKKDFSMLNYWLINMDKKLNLTNISIIENIWNDRDNWDLKEISLIFLSYFISNKKTMTEFLIENKLDIFDYLIEKTDSIEIKELNNGKEVSVTYLLLPETIENANYESVDRLRIICEMLPIYEFYNAQGISPTPIVFDGLKLYDESNKRIPQENLVKMFHQYFNEMWLDVIRSNYETSTFYEWITFWYALRKDSLELLKIMINFMEMNLTGIKWSLSSGEKYLNITKRIVDGIKKDYFYPGAYDPFSENKLERINTYNFQGKYFFSFQNVILNFTKYLEAPNSEKIWIYNLKQVQAELDRMQEKFKDIIDSREIVLNDLEQIEKSEKSLVDRFLLLSLYFQENRNVKIISEEIVKNWNEENKQKKIHSIKKVLEANKFDQIKFIFPKYIFEKNSVLYLPLLVEDANKYSDEYNVALFFSLTSISDCSIDFIDILFLGDKKNTLSEKMMRVSVEFLKKLKIEIENNNFSETNNNQIPWLPLQIEEKYLELYDINLKIERDYNKFSDVEFLDCEKLLYLFWEFSYIKKHVKRTNKEINIYFEKKEKRLLVAIQNILSKMKKENSLFIDFSEEIYNDVVNNNNIFLDSNIDRLYESLQYLNQN